MKTNDFTPSTPSQDNGVDFWVKMFTPRTNAWRRATLKRLRADKQVFRDIAGNSGQNKGS